jgi:hypothetical protein
VVECDHAMGGLMHEHLNDAAQLGGGRRRHLRKNFSALSFIRLRFAGSRARAQVLRRWTPAAIVTLLATIALTAVITTPPAAAAKQAQPAQPMEADAPREAGEPIMAIVSIGSQQVTFYDADGWILRAPVSTGTTGRETPAGVFPNIENHHSTLYDDAWMPNMQRITWNGIALHGDGAKDALDRITIPKDVLDRIAPTALPRSSIIVSGEPLSRETNYRTEFVAVLNNQPQGGFLMRRPTVDAPLASGNEWGNDNFGFFFPRTIRAGANHFCILNSAQDICANDSLKML